MVLSLENFNKKESEKQMSLSSFKDAIPSGLRINRKAVAQVAATDALLTGTTEQDYRATREMLLNPKTRGEFATKQVALRDSIAESTMQSLTEIAADASIPLEERVALVQGNQGGFNSPFTYTPTLNTLSEESLISSSGDDETEDQAEFRYNFADEIDRVNGTKRRIAAAINTLRGEQDQSLGATMVDVAELFAPLAEWVHIDRLLADVDQNLGGDEGFTGLMGTQKEQLFETIRALPSSEREAFAYAVIDMVKQHENIILPDGNDLMTIDTLERMLLNNDYSNFEKWFDNATSVLDMLFVGGIARAATRPVKAATEGMNTSRASSEFMDGEIVTGGEVVLRDVNESQVEDIFDLDASQFSEVQDLQRIARSEATRTDVPPTAPSQVVKDTNPDMARTMHDTAMADQTGEAAEGLYGTSRVEAGAKDRLPEPELQPGRTPNKVEMTEPVYAEPPEIREARIRNGNTAISRDEMKRVTDKLSDNLRAMSDSVVIRSNLDGTFGVTVRYSPIDSSLKSYDEVIRQTEFAFRNYGLTEKNFQVVRRSGSNWVELGSKKADEVIGEGGDYAVAIKFDYQFRPEDLEDVDLLKTGNMLSRTLDRIPANVLSPSVLGQGSITQNLLDAASVIHPQIVNAASVAVDRTFGLKKIYVEAIDNFSKKYASMPKDRRAEITDYINKANSDGIPFKESDLWARGFSADEIDALKTWRRANDIMWHAANDDLLITLRSKGYKSVVHKDSDTMLVGRPVTRNNTASNRPMLAPGSAQGSDVTKLTVQQLDELYENGGEVVKLDEPIEVDGQWVNEVIARNTVDGSYTRALYDGQRVLAYRDGYYPVMYDANYFITKTIKTADGEVTKVVGSAKNAKDADNAIATLRGNEPKAVFSSRKDRRFNDVRTQQEIGEDGWNLAVNSGLSAQRVRGQRLKDYSAGVEKAQNTNLKDPLEAVANQISQLSYRIPMRQYFDTVKTRWMLNYGKHLDLPVNPRTGEPDFPSSVQMIKGKDGVKGSFVADARTNYNYIYSLENGYINGIDNMYRGVLHAASDFVKELGMGKAESVLLNATAISPVNGTKAAAFKLFLSLNPLRQAVVQRGQIAMIGAMNPEYLATGLAKDLWNLNRARFGVGEVDTRTKLLLSELNESGVLEAVDAHNFIRQDLLRLADVSATQKLRGGLMRPVDFSQKYGFDLAEQDNLVAAWLAHRDKAVKAGKDLSDQRVRDEILGQTRAFTLNMNRAGEMAYSQNTLGILTQFLSFQHKAFLQGITNKSLTPKHRAMLLGYSTAVFGTGATAFGVLIDRALKDMPAGPEKDILTDGMIHTLANGVATLVSGEKQAVDWGDLAPAEAYGIGNTIVGLIQTPVVDLFQQSPAGSLLFGNNPRIQNLYGSAMRYFGVHDDYETPGLETSLLDVSRTFLNLASGYSNGFKANYALRMREKISSGGSITDADVTGFEAMMQALGFQTVDEVSTREALGELYGDGTFEPDDVEQWYYDLRAHLARRGQTAQETETFARVYSEAWRVFGDDRPRAAEKIIQLLQRDANNNDYSMFQNLLRVIGYKTDEDIWNVINAMPPGTYRDNAMAIMETRNTE